MNSVDSLAGILVGAYLIAVVVNGNSKKLIEISRKDAAFWKWAIAFSVLVYLYNIPEISGPMAYIIALAFLGLFLSNIDPLQKGFADLWSQFGA